MSLLTLTHDNHAQLRQWLSSDNWVIACLCAGWCDVCGNYRTSFHRWADLHPDKHFVWIDIEDQADLVGDLDIENFPTLLMQHNNIVAFYGTVLPDTQITNRLLLAQIQTSDHELHTQAMSNEKHQRWQQRCNLRLRLDLL